jgi:hypothetical protein
MGSFDKSYYDLLNKYKGILKEGMRVNPVYYKKTGNTYTPIQNNMELAKINPNEIYLASGDPSIPYVPYSVTTQQQSAPTQAPRPNQPSISITPDSGPQSSTSVAGQRVQSSTPNTTTTGTTPAPQPTTSNAQKAVVSPETQKAVADFVSDFKKQQANPTSVLNQKKGPTSGSTNNFSNKQTNSTSKSNQPLQFSGIPKS